MCGFNDQSQEQVRREQEKTAPMHVEEHREEQSLHQGFAYDQGSFVMFQRTQSGPVSQVDYKQDQASLIELGKRLKKRSYGDGKFFRRWKLRNSSEMKAILDASHNLTELMQKPVDKSTYAADLKSVRETYVYLMQSCQTYISTHNPETTEGQLRLDTVKQMEQQVKEEMEHLEGCADHILEQEGEHTWSEVLGGARTLKYRNGENGCTVSTAGAGTSKVYVLEGGPKKLFFKEKEPLAQPDFRSLIRTYELGLKKKIDNASGEEKESLNAYYEALSDIYAAYSKIDELYSFSEIRKIVEEGKPIDTPEAYKKYCIPDEFHYNKELMSLFEKCQTDGGSGFDLERFNRYVVVLKELSKMGNAAQNAKDNGFIGTDIRGEAYKTELSSRNVMTSRIAEALGLDDLVAKSKLATVEIDGKVRTGMAMEGAPGTEFAKVEEEHVGKTARYSPAAVRQLSNLYILDLLCGQIDRNLSNYFAQTAVEGDTVTVKSIMGIDNDMAFGCLPFEEMKRAGFGRLKSPYSDGTPSISSIDSELASKILLMNPSQLKMMAVDILTEQEIAALCDRLEGLQKMIKEAMEIDAKTDRKIFMFTEEDWKGFRDEVEGSSDAIQGAVEKSGYLEKRFFRHVLPPVKKEGEET